MCIIKNIYWAEYRPSIECPDCLIKKKKIIGHSRVLNCSYMYVAYVYGLKIEAFNQIINIYYSKNQALPFCVSIGERVNG